MGLSPILMESRTFREIEASPLTLEDRALMTLLMRDRLAAGELFSPADRFDAPARPTAPTAPTAPAAPSAPHAVETIGGVIRAPIDFTRVAPGDLITAGYMNGLIDAMRILDLRLIALESRGWIPATPTPATPATPETPAAPETPVTPSVAAPVIRAAVFVVNADRRGIVQIKGSGFVDVLKVQLGREAVDVPARQIKPTTITFVVVNGSELEGATVTVSTGAGRDRAELAKAGEREAVTLLAALESGRIE